MVFIAIIGYSDVMHCIGDDVTILLDSVALISTISVEESDSS